MNLHAVRLIEGTELKQAITEFAQRSQLRSGVIISAVGSLTQASIRMAGAAADSQDIRHYEGAFEIVSLIGTVSLDGELHLHIAISDPDGTVTGGHLKSAIVHTTVELAIAAEPAITFTRQTDKVTGFDELQITRS